MSEPPRQGAGRISSRTFPSGVRHAEVVFQNPGRRSGLGLRTLRSWLADVMAEVAPGATSVGVRFVGDREMKALNLRFRNRVGTTDVLSFAGGATAEGWHLGDIVVSVPAVARQAAEAGHGLERELRTLLLHGLLHCLGHDHEADDGEMDRLERRLRRRWVFRAGVASRAERRDER